MSRVDAPLPEPESAARSLADLGFLCRCDLPDRPGPAYLLVALRPRPTLRHYDPEVVDFWTSVNGRGVRERLTRFTAMPLRTPYSWGLIRIVDRLHVSNEYLSFGGDLVADAVADDVIAVFTSAAPILRRGGHSQDWDPGGEAVGAFFGRWMLAIDYVRGFEGRAARATPLARYSAFVQDAISRYRSSPSLAAEHPEFRALVTAEAHRLEQDHALDWAAARQLLRDLRSTTSSVIETQPPRLAESRR